MAPKDGVAALWRRAVVIPVFNGAETVSAVVEGLRRCQGDFALHVVLVNDGSTDGSDAVCRDLARTDPDLTYLRLARNFGEHNAVMTGLRYAGAAFVVVMDDDGQNPPESAMQLFEKAETVPFDLVYARYATLEQPLVRRLGSRFTNWVASRLLPSPAGVYLSSFKCMSAFLVEEVVKYEGPFPYVDGLALRCTDNVAVVDVEQRARRKGRSGYTLSKLLRLWLNMVINFSVLPLRAVTFAGLLMSLVGGLLAASVVVEKLADPSLPVGWASLMVGVTTFAGIQLLVLGLIGEYLGALFLAANGTPQAVVREVLGKGVQT